MVAGDQLFLLGPAQGSPGIVELGSTDPPRARRNILIGVREGVEFGNSILIVQGNGQILRVPRFPLSKHGSLATTGGSSMGSTLVTEPIPPSMGDGFSLLGPSSSPPDYRIRFLVAGPGVRLDGVGNGGGLSITSTVPTHTAIRAADVVATGGQISLDINFDVSPPNWPLGPQFTLPVLVYNRATSQNHAGLVNARVNGERPVDPTPLCSPTFRRPGASILSCRSYGQWTHRRGKTPRALSRGWSPSPLPRPWCTVVHWWSPPTPCLAVGHGA